MRIAVAGGTGLMGRLVVAALADAGHDPVVLARSTGVDLVTGAGLDEALAGAAAVVDVSNVVTFNRRRSVEYFESSTANLLAAGARAGLRHHVALSIVGVDRVDLGYYLGKRAQEALVLAGPVPATVVRATQFHEFAGQLLARGKGPLAVVPRMRIQPVAAAEVAALLAGVAVEDPSGLGLEIAGPQVRDLAELTRLLLAAQRSRRAVLSVRLPGEVGRRMAGGALLPAAPGPRGSQRFEEWLAARAAPGAG